MSSVMTPRSRRTAYSASPKSSPTGPITRVSARNEEASEKCTAAPPSRRSRLAVCVSTASNAMDPTTVRLMRASEGIVRRRASHPHQRVGRPRGARARRGRAGPRARRRPGPDPRRARRHELRRHPRAGELLPRPLRAAADPGRRGGRACARTPGERVVALVGTGGYAEYVAADEATIVPDRGRRERRHRAGAAAAGPDGLAPVPDLREARRRARASSCTRRPAGSARSPSSSAATWARAA